MDEQQRLVYEEMGSMLLDYCDERGIDIGIEILSTKSETLVFKVDVEFESLL